MRKMIIATMAPVLWILTAFDAVSIFFMFRAYKRQKASEISLLTGILCLGLFYDSLILSSGALLSFGPLLKTLSQFRYILHCVLIPLLFPICGHSLKASGKTMKLIWALSIVIMLIGLYAGISVITEERTVGAIRRYAESEQTGRFADTVISLLDTVPVFFMIGIGIYLWIRKKNPNMFFSGLFMLLFTLLGIFLGKDPGGDRTQSLMFYISMFGESLMVYFLYRFIRKEGKA